MSQLKWFEDWRANPDRLSAQDAWELALCSKIFRQPVKTTLHGSLDGGTASCWLQCMRRYVGVSNFRSVYSARINRALDLEYIHSLGYHAINVSGAD